jgi:hypothetical protein
MPSPCNSCAVSAQCQPYGAEFLAADGVFIKEMRIPFRDTLVPQHSHAHDHTSYLAKGSVECNGVRYDAPAPIYIPAGVKHMFRSLEDDTLVLCIHNVSRTGAVEVLEENQPFARLQGGV